MLRLTPLALLLALSACSSDSTEAAEAEAATGEQVTATDPATEVSAPVELDAAQLAVTDSFHALQAACLEGDGSKVHAQFAKATRDHWVHIKGLALNAEKEKLRREGMVVQLAVLVLRAKAGFETIESLDEVGMIEYALTHNLLGNQMVLGLELVDIMVDGDQAESGARDGTTGKPMEIRYGFALEDGQWRVDLTPAYRMANEIFAAKRASHGVPGDEEEALYFLVGNATGNAGTPELWTPLSELTDN